MNTTRTNQTKRRTITRKQRALKIIISIVFSVFIALLVYVISGPRAAGTTTAGHIQRRVHSLRQVVQPRYHIMLGGDIMIGRRTEANVHKYGNGDYGYPWEFVAPLFRDADIAFVNHEGVASDIGVDSGKRYSFRFKPDSVNGLSYAGIDVVSLANNHAMDWGYDALCDSIQRINAVGVAVVGAGCNRADVHAPYIHILPDGTRVAFLAIAQASQWAVPGKNTPGLSPFDASWVIAQTRKLKQSGQADIVVVSVHMGTEHSFTHNQEQEDLYYTLIDGGVDVIAGHHPHVPQEIEQYGDGWIIYSLGNLIFDMHDAIPHTKRQIMVDVVIEDGQVIQANPIDIEMNEYFQPVPMG